MRIQIMRRKGRKFFECQWVDPTTGKKRTKTTGTTKRRDAERFAARLQTDILAGKYSTSKRMTWTDFQDRYIAEVHAEISQRSIDENMTTFNKISETMSPAFVDVIDTAMISDFKSELYGQGLSGYTVKKHLSNLRKYLRWAFRQGIVSEMPNIDMPKKLITERGRPITAEEFERMLGATHKVVGAERAESWQHLLTGLWWSGLRRQEAMLLHWTDDRNVTMDFSGDHPMFLIAARADKARIDRVTPMAPEFAEFIGEYGSGFVFNPERKTPGRRLTATHVGRIISRIGKAAGVVVSKTGSSVKYASSHDLRRSFGFRWSQRVLPDVLQEMMRHADYKTTKQFYVGRNANVSASAMWQAFANKTANTTHPE